jgi:hypothetical protein
VARATRVRWNGRAEAPLERSAERNPFRLFDDTEDQKYYTADRPSGIRPTALLFSYAVKHAHRKDTASTYALRVARALRQHAGRPVGRRLGVVRAASDPRGEGRTRIEATGRSPGREPGKLLVQQA